jgi:hypothetical protein
MVMIWTAAAFWGEHGRNGGASRPVSCSCPTITVPFVGATAIRTSRRRISTALRRTEFDRFSRALSAFLREPC